MVIGHNIVIIPTIGKKFILVNSLNGTIIRLDQAHQDIFSAWQKNGISLASEIETSLYNFLSKHGFIYDSIEDEKGFRDRLISQVDRIHSMPDKSHLTFVLSYKCNFSCPYCYENSPHRILPVDIITKEMVDSALALHEGRLKSINLFGGEPLLPENADIIHYIVEKCPGISFSAFTNGYYLLDFFDVFSKVKTDYIQVTLDGGEESHNRTRKTKDGTKSFARIIEGIGLYLNHGIPVKVRMNLTKTNLQDYFFLRDYLEKLFFTHKHILSFELFPIFQLGESEHISVLKDMYSTDINLANEPSQVSRNTILSSSLPILNFFTSGKGFRPITRYCDSHTNRRCYDPLGNIYSCIVALGNPTAAIGTYFPDYSLRENSMVDRNITKIEECKDCIYALLCGGGCPIHFAKRGESVFQPNCQYTLNVIHNLLPYVDSIRNPEG